MVHSLSRIAPALPLLLSATLFSSDTGKELTRVVVPTHAAVAQESGVAPLEFEPATSVCSADAELTLQSTENGPRQLACSASPRRQTATSSFSCVAYSWGWKCFYPDWYCFFYYSGGVYCYPYTDQYGW